MTTNSYFCKLRQACDDNDYEDYPRDGKSTTAAQEEEQLHYMDELLMSRCARIYQMQGYSEIATAAEVDAITAHEENDRLSEKREGAPHGGRETARG